MATTRESTRTSEGRRTRLRVELLEDRTTPATDLAVGLFSNEPTLVVNPFNPNNIVIGDYNQGFQTLKISNDGGATFPITRNAQFVPGQAFFAGDDSLTFDSQGRLFWTYLTGAGNSLGVGVQQVNPTTGALIGAPVPAVALANNDKQWIAADANPASPFKDNLYMIWHDFNQTNAPVMYIRSTNGGLTWSAPVNLVTSPSLGFTWPSEIAVGPNGDVWVAWHAGFNTEVGEVRMRRSTNGGLSFGAEFSPFPAGTASTTTNSFNGVGNKIFQLHSWLQGSMQPRILVDPVRPGNIYVVCVDDPDAFFPLNTPANDATNVVLARSTDSGLTWSRSTISQGPYGNNEFMPSAGIDAQGNIAVNWYDTRRGLFVSDPAVGGNRYLLDVFSTSSTDGGLTWSAPIMINDPSNPFDPERGAPDRFGNHTMRVGEYNGLVVANGVASTVWAGNTSTGQQVFFDKYTIANVTPPVPPTSGTVNGSVWRDLNRNGVLDTGEPKLSGWDIFADLNTNGTRDTGEPGATSDSAGNYTLFAVPFGPRQIREVVKPGWTKTFPAGDFHTVNLSETVLNVGGVNFGNARDVTELGAVDHSDWAFDLVGAGWSTTGSGYLGSSLSHAPVVGISNGGFEAGLFTSWTTTGNNTIRNATFGTGPTEGVFQALANNNGGVAAATLESFIGVNPGQLSSTGPGTPTNGSAFKQTITVTAGTLLLFDWNFLTSEGPGQVAFNDRSFVAISPVAGGGTLQALGSTQTPGLVTAPGASGFAFMTGFRGFAYVFPVGGTFTVSIGAINAGDTSVQSAVLVDNVRVIGPSGNASATWFVVPPDVGAYELFVTWVPHANNATNATYKVYDGQTLVGTIPVNQQNAPIDYQAGGVNWKSLGTFNCTDGMFMVTLDNSANGNVSVDAVLLAPTPPSGSADTGNAVPPFRPARVPTGEDGGPPAGDSDHAGPGSPTSEGYWANPGPNSRDAGGGSGGGAGGGESARLISAPPGSPLRPVTPAADPSSSDESAPESTDGQELVAGTWPPDEEEDGTVTAITKENPEDGNPEGNWWGIELDSLDPE